MKTIIAGSRSVTSVALVSKAISYAKRNGIVVSEVVSGTVKGVDQIGEYLAEKYGKPITRFPADWTNFGKRAGYLRNAEMAQYADSLIAVWDGESRGTRHMIDLALRKEPKIPVFVFYDPSEMWMMYNSPLTDKHLITNAEGFLDE